MSGHGHCWLLCGVSLSLTKKEGVMSRTCFTWGAAAGLVLCTGMAFAQAPAARPRTEAREGRRSESVRRGTMVMGGTVTLKDGHRLGRIEDFIFDDGGCIAMAVVTYGDYYVA